MLRSEVLQALLDRYPNPSYLEIGTFAGTTFHVLRAGRKVAVDPEFKFVVPQMADPAVSYHEMTSDRYFGAFIGKRDRFDVIYLDGLHSFEQTLRDLMNAVHHLAPGGVIVVDDVIPTTFYAALPDYAQFDAIYRIMGEVDGSWMGDVYKLVFFVETFLQSFSYATVADNHGQLVMWECPRPTVSERPIRAFAELTYPDVLLARETFHIKPMAEILREIASH